MNVLVLGRALPCAGTSVGKFELEQAALLADMGHVAAYGFFDTRSLLHNRHVGAVRARRDGVEVFGHSLPLMARFTEGPLAHIKTRGLVRVLEEAEQKLGGIDVVYLHFPLLSATPGFLDYLSEHGVPLAVMEHWTKVQARALNPAQERFLQKTYDTATEFACVSEDLRGSVADMVGADERAIRVIPNLVGREFTHRPDGRRRFFFTAVGRLTTVKRFDLVVEAFARTAARDHAILQIVGTGPELSKLRRQARSLGLADRVDFLGWKSQSETADLLNGSSCYVSASPLETFGVPFVEAWMCGVPCIGADDNPLRSSFGETNGKLFETGSVESLSRAMDFVWENRLIANSGAIAAWAEGSFSRAVVAGEIEQLLCDASGSNPHLRCS